MYFIACLQQEFAAICKIRKDLHGIPLLLPFWHRAFYAMYFIFFCCCCSFSYRIFLVVIIFFIYIQSLCLHVLFSWGVLDGWVVLQNALLLSLTRNLNWESVSCFSTCRDSNAEDSICGIWAPVLNFCPLTHLSSCSDSSWQSFGTNNKILDGF